MELTMGPEYEAFRDEVRSFLESHKDDAPSSGVGADRDARIYDWQSTLIENGYAARTVPKEYGGYGAEPDLLETCRQGFADDGIGSAVVRQWSPG